MDKQKIMEYVAEWFDVEPDEEGKFDIQDYNWQAGCYHNHVWLNLAEIVSLIKHICEEEGFEDEY